VSLPPELGGFTDVDGSGRPGEYAAYLDDARDVEAVRRWKERSFEALHPRPGAVLMDVGCGTGDDVLRLAALAPGGRVVGVDPSEAMLEEARRRAAAAAAADPPPPSAAVEFVRGVVPGLSAPDGSLDGIRAERTLLHIADPGAAMDDMARALRPGGRLVVAEPDWGTLVVDAEPARVADAIAAAAGEGFRSPHIGRSLHRLARAAGLVDVEIAGRTLVVTDPAQAVALFGLTGAAERAVRDGRITADEAAALEPRLAAMTSFMVSGRKP
jgi:SAM-dependent methyltransferase